MRLSPLQNESQPAGSFGPHANDLLNTTLVGSDGSNWVIALSIPKPGRPRNTPPTSMAVAHSSYTDRHAGLGRRRMLAAKGASRQLAIASPKSAMWRV